jgi:aspartokinase/homoserine dehydrogenase 1
VVLGRNGSDYSAAVLAACLRADCCEIWTDVDGVYTCDPRQVPDARLLKSMSYQEAMELSYFGAKVLHPRTIAIAQFQIPCLIKNTGNPQAPGTLIGASRDEDDLPVKGISNLNNMAMFNVSGPGMKGMVGMAARVFATMSRAGISVVLITQSSSEYSISFCVPQSDCARAKRAMEDEFYLELKEGCWSRWPLWSVWRSSPWWATGCAPCAVSRRNSLPRWPAPISISWRLPRALPSALFRWWSAMTMPPPACA